jgi:hypothetical protein
MNNELIYDVILRLDPASLKKTQDELNKAMEATRAQGQGAGQAQIIRETADALKDFNKVVLEQNKAQQTSFKSLADLSAEMERQKSSLAELAEIQKVNGTLSEEQAQHQEEIKVAMKAASIEYNNQTRELADVARAGDLAGNTYDDLVKQNRSLMIQMRKVPLNDTTGELQRLQGQYKANSDTLKDFDKNIGVNFRNVGNYKSALEGAGTALGSMKGPVGGAANSLMGFNAVVRANPIMAVTQIVMVFINALSKLQVATEGVARVMAVLSSSFTYLTNRVGAFLGINEKSNLSLGQSITLAYRLKQAEQDLVRTEIASITVKQTLQTQIAKLRTAIMDENLSTEQKLALIDEALVKEKQLTQVETYLAYQRTKIAKETLDLDTQNIEKQREFAEALAAQDRVEADSANRQRELAEKRIGLINTVRGAQKTAHTEDLKRIAELNEARKLGDLGDDAVVDDTLNAELEAEAKRAEMLLQANFAYFEARKLQEIEAVRASGNELGAIEMERQMALQQIRVDAINAGITSEEEIRQLQAVKNLEFDKTVEKTRTEILKEAIANRSKLMGMAVDGAMKLGKALFGESKGMAIAQALIDTYQSANVALKSAPPPFNFALAAANVAAGIVNVNKIRSMKPGSTSGGSSSTPSAPSVSVPSSASTSFGTVDTNSLSASMGGANNRPPVLILQGDLDSELLAIRVRQGSDQLSSRGVSVVSA